MTQFPPMPPTPPPTDPGLSHERELYCRGCVYPVSSLGEEAGACPTCGRPFDLRRPQSTRSWPKPDATERGRTRIVWIALVLLVSGIAVMQAMQYAPPIPGSLPSSEDVSSPFLKVMGKVGIGLKSMSGGAAALASSGQDEDLIKQVDQTALNVIDLLRAAPVAAWIKDPAAGLSRLDAFEGVLAQEESWRSGLAEALSRAKSTLAAREGAMTPEDRDPITADAERMLQSAESELEALRLDAKSSWSAPDPIVESRLSMRIAAGKLLQSIGEQGSRAAAREELVAWIKQADKGSEELSKLRGDAATMRVLLEEGPSNVPAGAFDELQRRHNWFAQVAGAVHSAPSDAVRMKLQSKGLIAIAYLIPAVSVAVIAVLVGVVLLIVILVRLSSGKLARRFPWDQAHFEPTRGTLLETITIFLAGFIVLQVVAAVLARVTGIDAKHVLMWGLLLIAGWPTLRQLQWRRTRLAIGWHSGRGVLREMGAGIVGYLAGLPFVMVSFLVSMVIISLFHQKPTHPVVDELGKVSVWTLVLMFLLATVWAPVVEETMFRGAFYSHLRRVTNPIVAALVVGFVFAVIHPQGISLVPPLMTLGAVFALIREWRGSLIGSMTAHAVHNGFLVTMMAVLFS